MKIVLCNGVFDLLHVAHKRHLEEASKWGRVVVGVTKDACVGKPERPIIPQKERLEMVRSLSFVSDAALCGNSLEALRVWKPDVFCKGHDYLKKGLLREEIAYCKRHKIQIVHTKENPQTTSNIIERIKCGFC